MIHLLEDVVLEGCILIIPSVSVGNIGQLTVDLLISSLKLSRLGYLWHPSLIPAVGNNPYSKKSQLTVGCELYYGKDLKIVVLQNRSAFGQNWKDFMTKLCLWANEQKISQTIILSGAHLYTRIDSQLVGDPLRYLFCPKTTELEKEDAEARGWVELETFSSPNANEICLAGSGITIPLFKKCIETGLPAAVLVEFCEDGNNTLDATKLAEYLDSWLSLSTKVNPDKKKWKWSIPHSWTMLSGAPPPEQMF